MEPIEKALELSDTLSGLRPLDKDQEAIIMQKFRLDWNYNSNNLEGNSLTFGETKALILFGITAQGKPLKDHFEITGHDEAIKWVTELVSGDQPLTENFIRELHLLLLKESYEVRAITPDGQPTRRRIAVGQYKTAPNHVQTITGEIFRFATPEETPAKMHDLIEWYRSKSNEPNANAIILAAEFHYRFIRIHPFDDGNGRTARILMNFILLKFGYPPVIIKTEDKENYFAALQQADAGIIQPFLDYIAINLIRSLEIMIAGAKGESIEEPDDVDKELALLEQRLKFRDQGLGQLRTVAHMQDVFDQSGLTLLPAFLRESLKFDRFYNAVEAVLVATRENGSSTYPIADKYSFSEKFTSETNGFNIQRTFSDSFYSDLGSLIYESSVSFKFADRGVYQIKFAGATIEKRYGENLSDKEIESILLALSKAHTAFIKGNINNSN